MSVKLKTPEAILSYPNLFQARKGMDADSKEKFGCTLLFAEGTDLSELATVILQVATEEWGSNARDMIAKGQLHQPLRTDIDSKDGYRARAGAGTFINVRSTQKPGIVQPYADPATGKAMIVTDPDAIYPGMIVRAFLSCYAYKFSMKRGVTFGLEGIQILRAGERLDGRVAAEDAFEVDPDASPADFANLPGQVTDPALVEASVPAIAVGTPFGSPAVAAPAAKVADPFGALLPR